MNSMHLAHPATPASLQLTQRLRRQLCLVCERPAAVSSQVNKAHQLADWRVRPLDPVLLAYARQDTHHLLHIADRLKVWTWSRGETACPAA